MAKQPCTGTRKDGQPCTANARANSDRCRHHPHGQEHTYFPHNEWGPRWLNAYRETGRVSAACQAAGISRKTAYDRRKADPEFAQAWQDIFDETTDELEREAYERARGWEQPVFDANGAPVGTIRRYSDKMMEIMLKARKPAVYRERFDHRVSGGEGGPVKIESTTRTEPEHLAAMWQKAAETGMLTLPATAVNGNGNGNGNGSNGDGRH